LNPRITCPKCNNVFITISLPLNFGSDKTKIVRSCSPCYSSLDIFEDKETQPAKKADDRKIQKEGKTNKKTQFKRCKFKPGYLGYLSKVKHISSECFD